MQKKNYVCKAMLNCTFNRKRYRKLKIQIHLAVFINIYKLEVKQL